MIKINKLIILSECVCMCMLACMQVCVVEVGGVVLMIQLLLSPAYLLYHVHV